jgi:transketolase
MTAARVFVLIGDGELDEGSNQEAIAFARAARLDALHVVVMDNSSSTHGWPGGIEARFTTEGWSARRVAGRDHAALEAALTAPHTGRPHAVVAVVEPNS